ncbi:putative receptor-like protein kinase [Artemisia annua]|uniref:Putative receptor-like protein kinase n=1 Tax=Artemisia annua TaxID=35608 RepID=A0A2U1Q476_ARTAN|nr:putative receptor-like protein kinase [Artemisia annua]
MGPLKHKKWDLILKGIHIFTKVKQNYVLIVNGKTWKFVFFVNSSVDREWKNMEVSVEVKAFYSDFQGELLLSSATSMQRMSVKGSWIKSGFTGLKYSSLLNLVHLTGSLKEHLNVTLDPLKAPLDWKTRLKIVVGVTAALLSFQA